jgi:purine-binding chemotaxis protein CheW
MGKNKTESDLPIPPDLVGVTGLEEASGSDDWDQLFSPEADDQLVSVPNPEVAGEEDAAPVSTRFLGFRLGKEYFAIPILHLSEVVRFQEITAVPRVRRFVRGIISVRGTIVPILDLQRRLSQPRSSGEPSATTTGAGASDPRDQGRSGVDEDRRVLITQHGAEVFGLLVDEVSDVFVAEPDDIEPPPATLPRRLLDFVSGIARVQGRIHTVLEVSAVLRFTAVARAYRPAEVVQ